MVCSSVKKDIAIRAEKNGSKIIKLLEMLGGYNSHQFNGECENAVYYINTSGVIYYMLMDDVLLDEWSLYTYDSFCKKYPFVLGDCVSVQGWRDLGYIIRMYIRNSQVLYDIAFNDKHNSIATGVCVDCIKYYRGANIMNGGLTLKLEHSKKGNIEFDLDKFSYELIDGKLIVKEKSNEYPKTYSECCEVLVGRKPNENEVSFDDMYLYLMDCNKTNNIEYQFLMAHEINSLFRLLMCRAAYWKIAGEQMGLGKPWEPEWNHINRRFYCIYNFKSNIVKNVIYTENKILAFPTEEIRDAFYENFKDLIEQCKELL